MKHYYLKSLYVALLLHIGWANLLPVASWKGRLSSIAIHKYHRSYERKPSCDIRKNGELTIIKKLTANNDIIFDVGAYHGEWTKHVLAHCTPHRVYTFEPVPSSYNKLCTAITNTPVTHINAAPSKKNDTLTFYHYTNQNAQTMSSLYRRSAEVEKRLGITPTIITVPTITIDSFCQERAIEHIDLLKIDTEGAEYDVLQGAQAMLSKHAIGFIQFEYGGTYKDAHITLKEVCSFLTRQNYRIFKITQNALLHIQAWQDSLENYEYSNFLAISPTITQSYATVSGL